jgi:hypothetical protein
VITPVAGLIFIVLCVIVLCVIVLSALYRKREVKASLKIPFVTFSLEANDHGDDPRPAKK